MWRSSRFLKTLLFGILCIGCVEKSDPYPDPSQGGDGEPGVEGPTADGDGGGVRKGEGHEER